MSKFTSINAPAPPPPPSSVPSRQDSSEPEADELVDELDIATDDDELAEEELIANGGVSAAGTSRVRTKPSTERTPGKSLLPVSRVETIAHSQGDIAPFTKEAVFALCIATEEFMKITAETGWSAVPTERRSIANYRDMAGALARRKRFKFLRDTIPLPMTLARALELRASGVREIPPETEPEPPALKNQKKADSASTKGKQSASASASASTPKVKGKSKASTNGRETSGRKRDRAYHNGHASASLKGIVSAAPRRESRRVQERSARLALSEGASAGPSTTEEQQNDMQDVVVDVSARPDSPEPSSSRQSRAPSSRRQARSPKPTPTSELPKIKVRPSPHANGHTGPVTFSASPAVAEKDRRSFKRPSPPTPTHDPQANGESTSSPLRKKIRLSRPDSPVNVSNGRGESPTGRNGLCMEQEETPPETPRKWPSTLGPSDELGHGIFGATPGRTIYSPGVKQSGSA